MELKHSFTVPVSLDRAWDVLLDVERVATCMPGATLDSVDGDDITGTIKVKVGPITQVYAGKAHFTERDRDAHVVTLEASGKETRGSGTASATVRSELTADGPEQTQVSVVTSLNVTGKAAQFGRGVLAEVSGKLVGIFAGNLAGMLAADPGAPAPDEPAPPAPATAAAATATAEMSAAGAGAASLALPIEDLNLPVRAYNSLRREGVHTVADLTGRTAQQLLAIDHIGPASVQDIRQRLADRGLSLAQSPATSSTLDESGTLAESGTLDESGRAAAEAPADAALSANGSGGPVPAFPAPAPAPAQPAAPAAWQPDDDAVDLLSVAGLPVLKRAIPVAAGLITVAVLALLRRRRRRSRG
jgi:carbon monoxide dehydrogenase subunit G